MYLGILDYKDPRPHCLSDSSCASPSAGDDGGGAAQGLMFVPNANADASNTRAGAAACTEIRRLLRHVQPVGTAGWQPRPGCAG